ncbi:hypothetical protein B0H17DRAFT_1081748, partial [Mycena rosella]
NPQLRALFFRLCSLGKGLSYTTQSSAKALQSSGPYCLSSFLTAESDRKSRSAHQVATVYLKEQPSIQRGSKMGKSGSHALSQPLKEMLDHFGRQWCDR